MYPYGGYYHHDSWDMRLPAPSPPPDARWHHTYRQSGHLSPEPAYRSNLRRSHSQGHVPGGSNIHIHNEIPVDTHVRAESRGPPVQAPMPPQMAPPPMMAAPPPMMAAPQPLFVPVYPPDHHARGPTRLGEDLLREELENLRLSRSRSRGRTTSDSADWYRWELKQKEKEAAEAEQKRRYEEEKKRIKTEYELKAAEEENKRRTAEAEAEAEHQRLIDDYEKKKREDAQKAKDAEAAFRAKMERQAQEARDREKKAHEDFLRRQREQEEEEEAKHREYLRRQKEKEEDEERQYREFLRKQKEKQDAADKAKKDEEAKVNATMKERLEKLGYSAQAIEIMLDPDKKKEKAKKERKRSRSPGAGAVVVVPPAPGAVVVSGGRGHVPIFPRIRRAHLDVETLDYYKVPWKFDPANPDFIVVMREMDKYETDVLFEHTARRRRNGKLFIEDRKKEPKYAWVRRRSSRSKSRGRDLRVEIKKA